MAKVVQDIVSKAKSGSIEKEFRTGKIITSLSGEQTPRMAYKQNFSFELMGNNEFH